MKISIKHLVILVAPLALIACAGGGGGGSSSSASNGNVTTTATGFSGQSNWVSTAGGQVTSVSAYNQATSGLTYTETVNSSNVVQSNSFTSSAGTTVSFNRANGDTIANVGTGPLTNKAYIESNGNDVAIITPASMNGWSYQSYGVWITGGNGTSGTAGGGSAGSLTTGIAIPTSGTATFTGNTAGVYVNYAGQGYLTGSTLTANVDFANRTLGFATSGTQAIATGPSGTWVAANGLNMTGTLSYASGTNLITGSVATTGQGPGSAGNAASLAGTATGKFYGPTANEVGGTFAVKAGSGVETYLGAFGAKR